jgi:hypothetical protein
MAQPSRPLILVATIVLILVFLYIARRNQIGAPASAIGRLQSYEIVT